MMGTALRNHRNRDNRTLAQVAADLGVSISTVWRIEMGGRMNSRTEYRLYDYLKAHKALHLGATA